MASRLGGESRRPHVASKALRADIKAANDQVAIERNAAEAQRKLDRKQQQCGGIVLVIETPQEAEARKARTKARQKRKRAFERANPDQALVDKHVSPETQAHGLYAPDTIHGPLVGKDGEEEISTITVVRNRGGTTIERWHARGDINGDQLNAIQAYQSAWHLFLREPRVTANYAMVARGSVAGVSEENVAAKLRAKQTLQLIDKEVFLGKDLDYRDIWENVVIFDEPAGRAGSRLAGGFSNDAAQAAAKAIVLLLASEIAIAMRTRRRKT